MQNKKIFLSRRGFLQGCTASASLLFSPVLASCGVESSPRLHSGPAQQRYSLDQNWLLTLKRSVNATEQIIHREECCSVTLPHTVIPLSWQGWDPADWQKVWNYRRQFDLPNLDRNLRYLLHFDRVMAGAYPMLNGRPLPGHLGGYLPFEYEVTNLLTAENNRLTVTVDSRWLSAPPSGSLRGPDSIDYLLPGGITGSISLYAVPQIYIQDVFARGENVLESDRSLKLTVEVNAASRLPQQIQLIAELQQNGKTVAQSSQDILIRKPIVSVEFSIHPLNDIALWETQEPNLYDLVVTLYVAAEPIHNYHTRIGFREARFTADGFYLNGKRLQIFGLNRHELYPFMGYAAPARVEHKDAEILKREMNCNMVRCSHYPQSESFLNACDELGLLVWEELPGWQYLGDSSWQDLAVRDVSDMVRRDRNHPCVITWGVRINESHNAPVLYQRTKATALALDTTRTTTGTMTPESKRAWQTEWHQELFGFDDYHASAPGVVGIYPPLKGVPYLVSEAVGQYNYNTGDGFNLYYRRAGSALAQQQQAVFHAQAHDKVQEYPDCAGLIAWCAFEYASLMNGYNGVKFPGVYDFFRIPKLGAAFYRSQVKPSVYPVIEPSFYWDFGPRTPNGPGKNAAIFSNCERLELSLGEKHYATLFSDKSGYRNLAFPPFFVDLVFKENNSSELRIDGYIAHQQVITRRFSPDHSKDKLHVKIDDTLLEANGSDATRLSFRTVDCYGAPRPYTKGLVGFEVMGPAQIIGDNPFDLEPSGGAGAVWIRTLPQKVGQIDVIVFHSVYGSTALSLDAIPPHKNAPRYL